MPRSPALALFLAAAPAAAAAAVFVETSVEEVSRTADAVVHGKVVRQASSWSEDRRTIHTEVEISVASAWKGAPGATVRVVVPGGRVGDLAQRVDAAPAFRHGEDVVVFLSRRADFWELNGLALGKFEVRGGRAVPEVSVAEARPRPLRAGERRVEEMALDELRRRVEGAGR
jgi:hypothetical protein